MKKNSRNLELTTKSIIHSRYLESKKTFISWSFFLSILGIFVFDFLSKFLTKKEFLENNLPCLWGSPVLANTPWQDDNLPVWLALRITFNSKPKVRSEIGCGIVWMTLWMTIRMTLRMKSGRRALILLVRPLWMAKCGQKPHWCQIVWKLPVLDVTR